MFTNNMKCLAYLPESLKDPNKLTVQRNLRKRNQFSLGSKTALVAEWDLLFAIHLF